MAGRNANSVEDRHPLSFAGWTEALAGAPKADTTRREFTPEILGFLRHCKVNHAPATVMLAKE